MCSRPRQPGFSLIEVVVFIVILGISLVAVLLLYSQVATSSVDPMVRKQTLAIATSVLEEIELRAFTFCDPDDANVYTASGTGDCSTVEVAGPEAGETRYGVPRFDNVNDYHGFEMGSGTTSPGIKTATSDGTTSIPALADYSVRVTVEQISAGELGADVAVAEALRIRVTTTHVPTGIITILQGYRVRYAPNSP